MLNWAKTGIRSGRHGLWVAELLGNCVGVVFSQFPKDVNDWFSRLEAGDVLLLGQRAFERFWGVGIGRTFLRTVAMQFIDTGATVYADCSIHNKTSIRSIEKAGFGNLGKFPPLRRQSVELH